MMQHNDAFSCFHPAMNLLYFAFAIGFSFAFMHPLCLGISFACSIAYLLVLQRRKALRFILTFLLPMFLLAAIFNPLFSHAGTTVLAYFPGGSPLTLESIVYGIAAGAMLAAVIAWFRCFTAVMPSDKFVYLFGRIIPALSLVLSMALRFIPRFTAQMKAAAHAQRGLGRDVTQGNVLHRARHGIQILSVTVTWALENAVETADSMKCRGYGLPGRSTFAIYRFARRDGLVLLYILACAAVIITGAALGGLQFSYFPAAGGGRQPLTIALCAVYFAYLALPLVINAKEALQWKR